MVDPSLIQVSIVEMPAMTWPPDGPLYGDASDHARAFEAGLASVTPRPEERSHSVRLVSIVRALLDSQTCVDHWPAEAWRMLGDAVDEHVQAWVASHRGSLEAVPEVVDAVVWATRRALAPARHVPKAFAPVAVLLGPRLQELRYRTGDLEAMWGRGLSTRTAPGADTLTLVDILTPRWSAPGVVPRLDGRTWNPFALRIGERVAWHELSDRSVLEIAAFESWRELHFRTETRQLLRSLMITSCRRDLGFALAEAAYRDMLPTPGDLRIACDLAEARGVLTPDAIERWTLVELWARCMPLLWSLRGDREV